MPTVYVRRFNFKDSMSDSEVLNNWRFLVDEVVPAIEKVDGIRSIKLYSGAGALRADIRAVIEMDDAGAYERMIMNPDVGKLIGRVYGAWDLNTSPQQFLREVTPELIHALSSTG